ncbi:hypothetical protein [Rhodocaloribacter sp.]
MKWMIVALLFVLPYTSHAQAPDFLRAPAEAQDSLQVKYGNRIILSIFGSLGGAVVGGLAGNALFRNEIRHDSYGGLILIPFIFSGYVLGGVTGATLGGRNRKYIFLYGLGGNLAFIGTISLVGRIHQPTAATLAVVYLVGMPFFTSAISYSVDKAFARRQRRVRVFPVMSFGKRSSTLGVRITF